MRKKTTRKTTRPSDVAVAVCRVSVTTDVVWDTVVVVGGGGVVVACLRLHCTAISYMWSDRLFFITCSSSRSYIYVEFQPCNGGGHGAGGRPVPQAAHRPEILAPPPIILPEWSIKTFETDISWQCEDYQSFLYFKHYTRYTSLFCVQESHIYVSSIVIEVQVIQVISL